MIEGQNFKLLCTHTHTRTHARTHARAKTPELVAHSSFCFSWDEMAMYDLPATVRKVLSVTQSQTLAYVAFSQGTEIAFAQLSRDPELARQIKIFVALAPVAYTDGIKSPIRLLAPFAGDIAVSTHIFIEWIF